MGRLVKLVWILSGLVLLLSLADRFGCTRGLWDRVLPETTLVRPATIEETRIGQVREQIEELEQEIAELERAAAESDKKQRDLMARLRERCAGHDAERPSEELLMGDPVIGALVRSVDAERKSRADLEGERTEHRLRLAGLEARLIALRNGISQLSPNEVVGPSERLRSADGGETPEDRHRRIIREAIGRTQ